MELLPRRDDNTNFPPTSLSDNVFFFHIQLQNPPGIVYFLNNHKVQLVLKLTLNYRSRIFSEDSNQASDPWLNLKESFIEMKTILSNNNCDN